MLERDRRDKVLIVLHQDHSTPGRIGTLLARRGLALDIRRPSLGEPLPATLAAHAGASARGGSCRVPARRLAACPRRARPL